MTDWSPLLQGGIEGLDTLTQILRERRMRNEAEAQRQLIRSERATDEQTAWERDQARAKGERERVLAEAKGNQLAGAGAAQRVLAPTTVNPNQPGVETDQMLPFNGQSLDMPVTRDQMQQRALAELPNLQPGQMESFKAGLSFWRDPNVDHLANLETQIKEYEVQIKGTQAKQALPESKARIRNYDEQPYGRERAKTLDPLTRQKVADYNKKIAAIQKKIDDVDNWLDPYDKAAAQAAISGFTRARDKLLGAQEKTQTAQPAQVAQADWTANLDPEDVAAIEEARAKGYSDDEIKALLQGE